MPHRLVSRSLRRRLGIALAVPLALLAAAAGILAVQVVRLSDAFSWLDRTDEILSRCYELQKQIIDQETAIRGFLLTEEQTFLDPFWRAHPLEMFGEVRTLLGEDSQGLLRLERARGRYEEWFALAARGVAPGADIAAIRSKAALHERRQRMERVRETFALLIENQSALRHRRAADAHSATKLTLWAIAPLFTLAGLIIAFLTRHQLRRVAATFSDALESEQRAKHDLEEEAWVRSARARISERLQGDLSLAEVGRRTAESLAAETGAKIVAVYLPEERAMKRVAGFAIDPAAPETFALGEGLVGEAASSQKTLKVAPPAEAPRLRSASAQVPPSEVMALPAIADGGVRAVVELGFFEAVPARVEALLASVGEMVALAVRSGDSKERLRTLLDESTRQGEELQAQQEELRATNDELQRQRDALATAQHALAGKATELEKASRYKSEFLANMSHELRTPLNSTLILARLLADDGKLSAEQRKFAETIHAAGNDLLELINDILDLSKIEAGRADVHLAEVRPARLVDAMVRTFEPVARERGLAFEVHVDSDLVLVTDEGKVAQILRNLLSNAFKFTERGGVQLVVRGEAGGISFAVKDTGIGVARHQHDVIFEAFRQADGTTNRRFGGTGLGLSISRELARLLGGTLTMTSEEGQGSTFVLRLPLRTASAPGPSASSSSSSLAPAAPSRLPERPRGTVLLVVEDDRAFAAVVEELAREKGFSCAFAGRADEGIEMARRFLPEAVLLDLNLPDHGGLSVLDALKRDPATRHIPVYVVSVEEPSQRVLAMGAVGHLRKPATREALAATLARLDGYRRARRRLLLVEDDSVQRSAMRQLLDPLTVEIDAVGTVSEALASLEQATYDCIVTDLALPDASGFDLCERLAGDARRSPPPVIVYTGRRLSLEEEERLRRTARAIIVKGARSPERLLDEVTLFLHQAEAELPAERQRMLRRALAREAAFDGKIILLAEDDVRNVYALTSVFEPRGAKLVVARNGREAVAKVSQSADIDLVLMDLMMPEMDGLQAIRAIRAAPRARALPIIALTAKAMPDDQRACLEAGANDYLAKPFEPEMLLSLCRIWLSR